MKHHLLFRRPTALLGTESVVTFPWERAVLPGYQVAIDIRRLDAMPDNETRLTALWRILGDDVERSWPSSERTSHNRRQMPASKR